MQHQPHSGGPGTDYPGGPGQPPPQAPGYGPPSGGQPGFPPPQGGGYPPAQGGGYPPPQGGQYPPPQGGAYPPPQGGQYPPPQGGQYPPSQGGAYPPPAPQGGQYPPLQGGQYPPPQGGQYPPPQGGQYPPPQGGAYPPAHGGYPPAQGGGYPSTHGGYPPPQAGPGVPTFHDGPVPPGAGGTQAWQPGRGDPHQWDGLPEKPLADDPNAEAPRYQPPQVPTGMPSFPGYQMPGQYAQFVPVPAPPPLPAPAGEPPKMNFDSVANLKEEECREALLAFVAENCCYGKGCAEDHKIQNIKPSTALHYKLETCTEARNTGYKYVPYRGGPVDGPHNGAPPLPWQIVCPPDQLFQNHTKLVEVPHTATIQMCERCNGRGFNRCWRCHGLGRTRCSSCGGDGRKRRHDPERGWYDECCHFCGGDGRKRCMTCHGHGSITCSECQGFRQLKTYIELSVNFVNHVDEYILEETDMPDELVKNVEGTTVFEQALPQVWPIIAYPVIEINVNSTRMVEEHRVGFPNERQLQQRQTLRAVPVTEVAYKWKDTSARYWVYGRERKVYSPDYPQSCCWGCEIL